jgi:hypothetical protein
MLIHRPGEDLISRVVPLRQLPGMASSSFLARLQLGVVSDMNRATIAGYREKAEAASSARRSDELSTACAGVNEQY